MNYRDALNRKAQKTKMKENWEVYKQQKSLINNIIKNTKINYHKNLLEENATKPEQFWKLLKACSLLNRNMRLHVQHLNLMVK